MIKNKDKISDLKKLIEISDDNYSEIINILKKYASTLKEAEMFVVRYSPYLIKEIDEKNILLILRKKLDVYQYYLFYSQDAINFELVDVKYLIGILTRMDNDEFVNYVLKSQYRGNYEKIKFLVTLHRIIKEEKNLSEEEKVKLSNKISYCESYFYTRDLKETKIRLMKPLKVKNDSHFNFVLDLINSDKDSWQGKLNEFLNNQKDELVSKNKILRIILLSKLGLSSRDMIKSYKLMDSLIDSSISYIFDPITGRKISKGVYKKTYGRVIKFFDEIINTTIDDETKIIETFSILSNDQYYGNLNEMLDRLNEIFPILHPEIANYELFLEERFNIYFEYRKKIRKDAMKLFLEKNKENRKLDKEAKIAFELENVRKFINEFIDSDYLVIEEYKHARSMKLGDLRNSLEILAEYDKELYEKFSEKQKKGMEVINKKIKQLLAYLTNGIGEAKRKFDVIDYYNIINVDIEVLRSLVINSSNLSNEEIYILVKFLGANYRHEKIGPNTLLNTDVEINCESDEKGNLIPGTGIVITKELREKAIRFLENHDMPLNDITYHTALRRYLKKYNISMNSSKKK